MARTPGLRPLLDPNASVVNGRYRATQSDVGLLARELLVIVSAEAENPRNPRGYLPGKHVAELTPRLWKSLFAHNPLRSIAYGLTR
jgi:hypothetical protein